MSFRSSALSLSKNGLVKFLLVAVGVLSVAAISGGVESAYAGKGDVSHPVQSGGTSCRECDSFVTDRTQVKCENANCGSKTLVQECVECEEEVGASDLHCSECGQGLDAKAECAVCGTTIADWLRDRTCSNSECQVTLVIECASGNCTEIFVADTTETQCTSCDMDPRTGEKPKPKFRKKVKKSVCVNCKNDQQKTGTNCTACKESVDYEVVWTCVGCGESGQKAGTVCTKCGNDPETGRALEIYCAGCGEPGQKAGEVCTKCSADPSRRNPKRGYMECRGCHMKDVLDNAAQCQHCHKNLVNGSDVVVCQNCQDDKQQAHTDCTDCGKPVDYEVIQCYNLACLRQNVKPDVACPHCDRMPRNGKRQRVNCANCNNANEKKCNDCSSCNKPVDYHVADCANCQTADERAGRDCSHCNKPVDYRVVNCVNCQVANVRAGQACSACNAPDPEVVTPVPPAAPGPAPAPPAPTQPVSGAVAPTLVSSAAAGEPGQESSGGKATRKVAGKEARKGARGNARRKAAGKQGGRKIARGNARRKAAGKNARKNARKNMRKNARKGVRKQGRKAAAKSASKKGADKSTASEKAASNAGAGS